MRIAKTMIGLFCLTGLTYAEPSPQLQIQGGDELLTGFSADGNRLYLNHSKRVHVFDLTRWRRVATLGGLDRACGVSLNRDGSLLAVGDYPRKLYVYDCNRDRLAWKFRGPTTSAEAKSCGAYHVEFSSSSNKLLCWGGTHGRGMLDNVVRLFDGSSGRLEFSWSDWDQRNDSNKLTWSPDGKYVLRGANDKVQSYSTSGQKLAEARLGGKVIHLDSLAGQVWCRHDTARADECVETRFSFPELRSLEKRPRYDSDVVDHPDGGLSWSREDHKLVVKGLAPSTVVFRGDAEDCLTRWVSGGGFVMSNMKGAHCFDRQGKLLSDLPPTYGPGRSPFALEGLGYGGPCGIYDLRSGKILGKFDFASGPGFSRDGKWLALCTRKGIVILDVAQSLEQGTLILRK